MKVFVLMVLLTVTSVSKADEYIKGVKVTPPREARFFYPTNPKLTCQSSPPGTSFCVESNSCNKGNKIFSCTDDYGYSEPVACAEPTPYCTGATGFAKCTAFPEQYCSSSSNYQCPGVGYFPDLYDCLTFYDCYYDSNLKKFIAEQRKCNSGYPFSPEGKGDYKCSNVGKCMVPKCSSANAAEWVPLNYTNFSNNMAVYCLAGRPKYVYSCPTGLTLNEYSLLYSESPWCEVKCTKEYLRAPFVTDNTRFYECRGGTPFLTFCTRGKIFDPSTMVCIAKPFTV